MRKITLSSFLGLLLTSQIYAFPACKQTEIDILNNTNIDFHYIGSNLDQSGGDDWQVELAGNTIAKKTGGSILISSLNNVMSKVDLQGYLNFTDGNNHQYRLLLEIPKKIHFSSPSASFSGFPSRMLSWIFNPIDGPLCLLSSTETLLINP